MSRKLRPEEVDLWRKVADTTDRKQMACWPEPAPKSRPEPKKPDPAPRAELPQFRIGQSTRDRGAAHDLLNPIHDHLRNAPVRMDRKAHTKMTRGKLKPDARIDLHGMTVDRAHTALTGFILRAHREGFRLVLVITGKGRDSDDDGPIPVRRGVLRHQVPHWLTVPPLGGLVLQVAPAHLRHGGGGAYYVYLRKNRG
ncbi:DNA mismatch repair protein MutS [Oceanicola sp. 22II-s10i]|uniref:Smr/MutS family protein n=1 Tax=Oceanicola sp. 22II-s10i TaxID=1317116 RepID=UPI000B523BEF|nr:Smr/MutS family protein [Oceanicola sp. 22II-s10i]OWU85972.1 DNA mismatch repair protein MutS [Oceanicola sp. 22II-s10i]